jgi:hypothetical protein
MMTHVRELRFTDWIRQVVRQIVRQIVCVCGENNIRHVDTISSPTCSTTCCTTDRTVCGPLKSVVKRERRLRQSQDII